MNKNTQAGPIGIVVTHGNLGEELLHTARLIVGDVSDCYAISNTDLCDDSLIGMISELIKSGGGRSAVLFVDYFGGSCCMNCVRATEGIKGVKVISGINLPLLLDFITKRNTMGFNDMIDHLIRRGRESVKVIDL